MLDSSIGVCENGYIKKQSQAGTIYIESMHTYFTAIMPEGDYIFLTTVCRMPA